MKVEVFTDGACSKNGQAGARASWAFYIPDHKDLSKADRVPEGELQSNQRGELMAISEAVKQCEKSFTTADTELKIYTDSTYSKNCLTTWLPNWVRNDWKNSQGQPVAHRDLIEATASSLSKFKSFTIAYVKAHTGGGDHESTCNHIVDRMAVKVLNPEEEVKVVTNTAQAVDGLPLQLMGPPVSERELITWCMTNLSKLDQDALGSALITALTKTVKKKGFEVVKQRLHRSNMYRLKTDTGLIKEEDSKK